MLEFMPLQPQLEKRDLMEPRLDIDDILAVQTLAMGFLRWRARRRLHDEQNQKHGFVMLDSDGPVPLSTEDIYDGSVDTYMGCLVRKLSFDQWTMRVSFVTNERTEDRRAELSRQVYAFDWLKNGNRMAWASTSRLSELPDGGRLREIYDIHPVDSAEAGQLMARMQDVSQRVNPLTEDSFMGTRPS